MSRFQAQKVLDLFIDEFDAVLSNDDGLKDRIQAVKTALYDRDYESAFTSDENLEAYVVRWTPARALAYRAFFQSLPELRQALDMDSDDKFRVLAIGAGAGAEVVSLGSLFWHDLRDPLPKRSLDLVVVDRAAWGPLLDRIVSKLNVKCEKAINHTFVQQDMLQVDLTSIQISTVDLITAMFTTNELFASSKRGTVRFLQALSACRPGTLLLILESAGSYSEIEIGSRKFKIQLLLQHTLTGNNHWQLVRSTDSLWYRLPEGTYYPLKLENMRYMFQMYKRL